jgi:acetyltransferase-like isoleucine patch superfamily enzyme
VAGRHQIEARIGPHKFENATIGEGTFIEPDVLVGFRYHEDCGPARVGKHGILRKGTIIYGDVTIGDYFLSGHYVVIRAKVQMGDYCTVLNQSTLEGLIHFGKGVRIMSHVYIPSRTWFGNDVFVGPGVTFLNDKLPGRLREMPIPKAARIEDNVMIGGGCTILPGITIGERSFIAAGSVVTKDVPPRSLVKGVPGKIESLPASLDMPNNPELTMQPIDIWHPLTTDLSKTDWPKES